MIHRVLEQTPQVFAAAHTLDPAEEYLADHFPSFPVMPGVLMIETLAQAAEALLKSLEDQHENHHHPQSTRDAGQGWVLDNVRNVRFGAIVTPGDELIVTVQRRDDQPISQCEAVEFHGRGQVGSQTAVQGRFTMRRVASLTPAGDFS